MHACYLLSSRSRFRFRFRFCLQFCTHLYYQGVSSLNPYILIEVYTSILTFAITIHYMYAKKITILLNCFYKIFFEKCKLKFILTKQNWLILPNNVINSCNPFMGHIYYQILLWAIFIVKHLKDYYYSCYLSKWWYLNQVFYKKKWVEKLWKVVKWGRNLQKIKVHIYIL